MSNNKMGDEFEAWWDREFDGRYMANDFAKGVARAAWQASRADLVIDMAGLDFNKPGDIIKAVDAAGIKWKSK